MFGDNDSYALGYLLISVGVVILMVLCTCLEWKEAKKREEQQKVSIFMYLQQFDVEDIDLRKSPPGGWHGTYMHKLAYGINQASRRSGGGINKPPPHPHYASSDDEDDESFYTHQTTHSSTARDSTFMDISPTSTSPSSGGGSSSFHQDRQEPAPLLGYDEFESRNTNHTGSSPSAMSSETNKMRMII